MKRHLKVYLKNFKNHIEATLPPDFKGVSIKEGASFSMRIIDHNWYVYKVFNPKTGLFYIGQTSSLLARMTGHKANRLHSKLRAKEFFDLKVEILLHVEGFVPPAKRKMVEGVCIRAMANDKCVNIVGIT